MQSFPLQISSWVVASNTQELYCYRIFLLIHVACCSPNRILFLLMCFRTDFNVLFLSEGNRARYYVSDVACVTPIIVTDSLGHGKSFDVQRLGFRSRRHRSS